MASTQTSTNNPPRCLLDDLNAVWTPHRQIRMAALAWAVPGVMLTVAGGRLSADRVASPSTLDQIAVSQALVVLLAVFTVAIAAIGLTRSEQQLPAVADLGRWPLSWKGHLILGGATVTFAAIAPTVDGGRSSLSTGIVAVAGGVALLIVPRWLILVSSVRGGDRVMQVSSALATVVGFELTVGTWYSSTLVDRFTATSGLIVAGRGLLLVVTALIAFTGCLSDEPVTP